MIELVQLPQRLHAVNSGTLSSPTVNGFMPHWISVWKIFTVQTNQERLRKKKSWVCVQKDANLFKVEIFNSNETYN